MKMPKGGLEEYILVAIVLVFLLLTLIFLNGCASKQTAVKLEYTDGCHFRLENISSAQAARIQKDWGIEPPCTINNSEEIGGKKEKEEE